MLCYDGQLRNGSVATHFILLSITAASSATGVYVVVPERPSRNEEPTSGNEEQTRNVPSSYLGLPQNLLIEFICILLTLEHDILKYLAHLFYFHRKQLMNNYWIFSNYWKRLMYYFLLIFIYCRRGKKCFDVHFRRIRHVFFLSRDGDDAASGEENGEENVYFQPESALSRWR